MLGGQAVILEFNVEVVSAKDGLKPTRELERLDVVILQQRLEHDPSETTRGRHDARGVTIQEFPVQTRFVVVALEKGQGREFSQVAITHVRDGEQREVVIELLAAFGVTTGVVDLAPARRTVESRVRGHVSLESDDGCDVVLTARLVKVDHAVQVAVVGDAQGRLTVRLRGQHQLFDARGAIKHGVFGVVVEMDETLSHQPNHSLRAAKLHGWDLHLSLATRVSTQCT